MRRTLLCLALFLVLVCSPSFAGMLNVSANAGMFSASGSDSPSVIYGLSADMSVFQNLSVRGMVQTTTYTSGGQQTTLMPISLDLLYSQSIAGMFHPYAGAGLSYNSSNTAGVSTQTTGGQAEAGFKFELAGFSAGVEYRYMILDFSHSNNSASTYNFYMSGGFSQSLPF